MYSAHRTFISSRSTSNFSRMSLCDDFDCFSNYLLLFISIKLWPHDLKGFEFSVFACVFQVQLRRHKRGRSAEYDDYPEDYQEYSDQSAFVTHHQHGSEENSPTHRNKPSPAHRGRNRRQGEDREYYREDTGEYGEDYRDQRDYGERESSGQIYRRENMNFYDEEYSDEHSGESTPSVERRGSHNNGDRNEYHSNGYHDTEREYVESR